MSEAITTQQVDVREGSEFEPSSLPTTGPQEQMIARARSELFNLWIQHFEENCASPIVNLDTFIDFLRISNEQKLPLICIAMGCQDWVRPSFAEDEKRDRIIRLVSKANPRALRVAQGFANFQQALQSFGVHTEIYFSLSDVEAAFEIALGNMGQIIHNPDALQNQVRSTTYIAELINEFGGSVHPFSHLEIIKTVFGITDLYEIQTKIAGRENPLYTEFLSGLYAFDLLHLTQIFLSDGKIGPIWIDLISPTYAQDIDEFRKHAQQINPTIPILAPFPNAGSWSNEAVPPNIILTRFGFVSHLLRIDQNLEREAWIRVALNKDDQIIGAFLSSLGINTVISNRKEKIDAVALVAEISFDGWDARELLTQQHLPVHDFNGPLPLVHVVASIKGSNNSSARGMIRGGGVRIAGTKVFDPTQLIVESCKIQIGKNRYLINFNHTDP